MEVQTKIVLDTAALLGPGVSIGPLPEEGGVTLNVSSGGVDDRYFSGRIRAHITLQLLCKQPKSEAYDTLCALCNKLDGLRFTQSADGYQLLGYQVESLPQFVGFEGGQSIYTAVIYAYYHA